MHLQTAFIVEVLQQVDVHVKLITVLRLVAQDVGQECAPHYFFHLGHLAAAGVDQFRASGKIAFRSEVLDGLRLAVF